MEERARSVPHKGPFLRALVFSSFFFLSLVATVAALVSVFSMRTRPAMVALVVCVGLNVFTWLVAYIIRRGASCPLCKGTPYVDLAAHKHVKAKRIAPLTYGMSNILSSIARQRYRCQYCGTPFDLLKEVDRQLPPGARR